MRYSTWVELERGRADIVADHFSVSKSAVSQWKVNGVPATRMLEVRDLSGGEVTLEEMLEEAAEAASRETAPVP